MERNEMFGSVHVNSISAFDIELWWKINSRWYYWKFPIATAPLYLVMKHTNLKSLLLVTIYLNVNQSSITEGQCKLFYVSYSQMALWCNGYDGLLIISRLWVQTSKRLSNFEGFCCLISWHSFNIGKTQILNNICLSSVHGHLKNLMHLAVI